MQGISHPAATLPAPPTTSPTTALGPLRWCPQHRRNEGWQGGTMPPGAEKSQQCRKYFLQYSRFTSERPQVRTWGSVILVSCPPGAI